MTDQPELSPRKQRILDKVQRLTAENAAELSELVNEVRVAQARFEEGQIDEAEMMRIYEDARRRSEGARALRKEPLTPRAQALADAMEAVKAKREQSGD